MTESTTLQLSPTIGLELGSATTQVAVYGADGKHIKERKISTTRRGIGGLLERFPGASVVMETSTASRWSNSFAQDC